MNKVILISNIKGGVGKTTLCALFCEYLKEKGFEVAAYDADIQASLSRHRERELEADSEQCASWTIDRLDTRNASKLEKVLKELHHKDGVVVIDCPGNLNDDNLSLVYRAADMIVIPMAYDVDTIDATGIFVSVVRRMSRAPFVFIPNRINVVEGKAKELQMRDETIDILGKLGTVTPRIKQSVVVKRYSTLYPLDRYQYAAVEHAFNKIIEEIKK